MSNSTETTELTADAVQAPRDRFGAFGVAFIRQRSLIGFVGLAAAVPFLWYASHAPGGEWFSPLLFLSLGAAAEWLRRGRRKWAAACVAPFVGVVVMLALLVATH